MSQPEIVDQQATEQFLDLYQSHRHQDQLDFYTHRVKEFTNAQRQALWFSIGLVFATALAGALEGITTSWLRTTLLLIAAICPILSTALAGYSALHGFTQQAKLYRDARNNLMHIRIPKSSEDQPGSLDTEAISTYVRQVEDVLQKEHGFWGQLAEGMAPPVS